MLKIENFKETYDKQEIKPLWNTPQLFNWSDIIDKLIRLSAKYTDSHASDVVISINNIQKEIDNYSFDENKSWLFGFRNGGVDHEEWVLSNSTEELRTRYRNIWRLDLTWHKEYKDNIELILYEVEHRN